MTVIIARQTPDKVRGLLKRWFIEPKPNVFVGSVNRKVREKVLAYMCANSPDDLSFLVIFNDRSSQGFAVRHYNDPAVQEIRLSGHYLLTSSPEESPSAPDEAPPFSPEALRRIREILGGAMISYRCKSSVSDPEP